MGASASSRSHAHAECYHDKQCRRWLGNLGCGEAEYAHAIIARRSIRLESGDGHALADQKRFAEEQRRHLAEFKDKHGELTDSSVGIREDRESNG